jgi:hypothetical protein
MVIIAILIYRSYVKKRLKHLAGSGRLTEIRAMELRKEYCLMWISVVFLINFMAKLITLN